MCERTGLVTAWRLVFTKQPQKDARRIATTGLRPKAEQLIAILADDPFRNPPPFEKLLGDLSGAYSRRINIQHRLVYQVVEKERTVKILRMWTHYE
jgi:Txe/YoeB family toxin of toxin-antitoxin system